MAPPESSHGRRGTLTGSVYPPGTARGVPASDPACSLRLDSESQARLRQRARKERRTGSQRGCLNWTAACARPVSWPCWHWKILTSCPVRLPHLRNAPFCWSRRRRWRPVPWLLPGEAGRARAVVDWRAWVGPQPGRPSGLVAALVVSFGARAPEPSPGVPGWQVGRGAAGQPPQPKKPSKSAWRIACSLCSQRRFWRQPLLREGKRQVSLKLVFVHLARRVRLVYRSPFSHTSKARQRAFHG